MSPLAKLTVVEGKLFLRELSAPGMAILLPPVLLLVFGSISGLNEPAEQFGGQRFIDVWAPSLIVISVAILGVQALPTTMATYRERGILRRLSTTPVHPASLLVADLLVYLVATLVAVALLVLVGWAVLDIPLPQHVAGFAAALLLGTAALFALGLVIAAVVPSARAATVVGIVVFLAVLFLGGVYLPSEVMPETIARIGVYTPPGAQALQDAWLGTGPSVLHLIVMAAIAVALCVVAALVFRWE